MIKKTTYILLTFLICFQGIALAQVSSEFQLATRLMQQHRYGDALPLLQEIAKENPDNYSFSDRLIECYIQLKQYDEGIEVANRFRKKEEIASQVNIRLGELYHFKDDTAKANQVWMQNIEDHSKQLQLYITTGQTMIERGEYLKAIEVYKKGRVQFKNERLFFGDIANAYMRAGNYENAIGEWLSLLREAPNQSGYIKRNLLRYNDPILFDITIVELDDRLENLNITDPVYPVFFDLQVWLLQENNLYRRALVAAKAYESKTSSFNYSLFNLGRQLSENKEFELAEDAFTYYIENANGDVRWRSMHELSNTYSRWAKYLDDYNLDFNNKRDSLYTLSLNLLDDIEAETSNYTKMADIYMKKAELSLDFIFDLDAAITALDKLKNTPEKAGSADIDYLEGRIHLSKKEYPQARINFTKANKKANIGNLAEKTRYFLALTDFYSGDYEFAKIQLKTLGRQNTSYYANDALELRLWLQEGITADTTGEELDQFADAVFKYNNGESRESANLFLSMIISRNKFNALKDDALLFFVNSKHAPDSTKFRYLNTYMASDPVTPVKEKLLWEQAKLAEKSSFTINSAKCKTSENCFFNPNYSKEIITPKDLYEELILSFPQGFYAPYARERLTELTRENS